MKSLAQYLTEANAPQNVNMIIGRFQPFTLGHLKCAEYAYKVKGVPSVICCIDTTKADERHPFLTKDIMPYMEKMARDERTIAGVVTVKNADIVKMADAVRAAGFEPVSWSCGTDRIDSYTTMAERYKDMAGLPDDFEVIEIPRTDEDISATRVRNAIKDDDQELFNKMTPKSWHGAYKKLQQMIEKV